jgi:inhibitor of cysteine peptidase
MLFLIIGAVGCSSTTAPDKNDLKMLESSGIQNSFKVGDSFKVVLKGNPSTGYAWNYTMDNKDIIELSSSNEVPDKENITGSGSTFIWHFKALKAGQIKLTYKYYRDWEREATAAKEDTIEYLITAVP